MSSLAVISSLPGLLHRRAACKPELLALVHERTTLAAAYCHVTSRIGVYEPPWQSQAVSDSESALLPPLKG